MTAPWLFWGSDQTMQIRVTSPGPPTFTIQSPQIARIDFGRPETWSFFLGAKLDNLLPFPGPGAVSHVEVRFLVTIGLARTTRAIILGPLIFELDGAVGPFVNNPIGQFAWATRGKSPIHFPSDTANPDHFEEVDSFAAQSINCVASVKAFNVPTGVGSFVADLTVSALFSPRTHIRPEWFKDGRFTGGEDYGT